MKDNKKDDFIQKIVFYSKELHFPAVRNYLAEGLEQARAKNLSYEEFLCDILQKEYDVRIENGKLNRIRIAGFPAKKYLEDLKMEHLPVDCRNKLKILASLDFVKNGQNLILYGNPGTGKTMIAIGLGIKAAIAGYRVFFTTVPLLINQLKEARGASTLRSFEMRFEKYDLVIADELCEASHNSSYVK